MSKKTKKEVEKVERRRRRRERLDDKGRELGDSTPMAPPVGYKREPTIAERIRQMVRGEALAQAARASGAETFEEADDFDVGDDDTYDPSTPYEEIFEPPAVDPPTPAAGVGGRGEALRPAGDPPAHSERSRSSGDVEQVPDATASTSKDGNKK